MNGNNWANILDNPEDRWKEGQFKDWRTFSTEDWRGVMGKARTMAGPIEPRKRLGQVNINFPEDLKAIRERRDLASEIDKILNSEDYMMLDPEGRAKVLKVLQAIQLEKDKPVEGVSRVTTPTKKTTQKEEPAKKREKPQGVQFRRVDGELVKEEAGKWWEDLTPEQEIAKRKAELETSDWYRARAEERETIGQADLMRIGAERREASRVASVKLEEANEAERLARLARQAYVDAEGRTLTAEKKAEELEGRDFKYKKATETREFEAEQAKKLQEQLNWQEEKGMERDKLFEDKRVWTAELGVDEAATRFDEGMRLLEYEGEAKELDRRYELDVEEFGETKAENIRQHDLEILKEKHSWKEILSNQGFKNKEFIELSKQFWGTLEDNKEKEKTRAEEFGLTYELDVEKEANVVREFDQTLKREYAQLDLDIETLGLNVETEKRIKTLALMNVALKTRQLGLDESIQALAEREADKAEWWNKKDYQLKDKNANRLLMETEARILNDIKETDLATAIHRENIRQYDETMELKWAELDDEAKEEEDFTLTIPTEFATTLSNMGSEVQGEVMRLIKSTYDPKKGENVLPSKTERDQITAFLIGAEDVETPKEKLGCNLSLDEYVNACLTAPMWTDRMRGYALRLKTEDVMWRGIINLARATEVLEEDKVEKRKPLAVRMAEKVAGWWPFGKKETPPAETIQPSIEADNSAIIVAEVDRIYAKTDSRGAVINYLKTQGLTFDEYKTMLRQYVGK